MKRLKKNFAMMLAMLMVVGTQSMIVLANEIDTGIDANVVAEGEESGKDAGNYAEENAAGADETVGTEETMTNEEAVTQETLAQGGIETYADNYVGDDVYGVEEVPTSGTCGDNLTWTLSDDGTLTISGTGRMMDGWHYSNFPTTSGELVKKVVIEEGVTSIGNEAFNAFLNLTEVEIAEGLQEIGKCAFSGCSKLEKINIPNSVNRIDYYAFTDCASLKEIAIPANVTSISEYTFSGCSNLASVTIPNSVTKIEYDAFNSCTSLPSVTVPASVTSIKGAAFGDCSSLSNVYFEGDAPAFSSERNGYAEPTESFANVTANVYYPYGNATYTVDNMLDYGGKLTWIAQNPADELEIVLEVTDKVYLIGSGGNATIKCTGELKDFVSVAVDGRLVDPSHYTTAEGSTVLTLLSAYLDTLSVGDHVVTMNYVYGSIDTTLTILDRNTSDENTSDNNQNTDTTNNGGNTGNSSDANNAGNLGGNKTNKYIANGAPKTGDATSLWMLWVLCAFSGVCIFSFVMRRKLLWKN